MNLKLRNSYLDKNIIIVRLNPAAAGLMRSNS